MTRKQKCLLGALATGAIAFTTSCACLAPQQSKMTVEELRANSKNVLVQAKLLSDSVGEHAAKLRNAADSKEFFAIEVKFFERAADKDAKPEEGLKVEVLDRAEASQLVHRLIRDRKTTTVSYPRFLTENRRPVEIRSVVNQPVIIDVDEIAKTTNIGYVPIGTQITICPTRLKNGKIDLATAILITAIIGDEVVGKERHPVVSSRIFSKPTTLRDGETFRISGANSEVADEDGMVLDVLISATSVPNPEKTEAGSTLRDFLPK